MALEKCPDCGSKVSSNSINCIKCGCPSHKFVPIGLRKYKQSIKNLIKRLKKIKTLYVVLASIIAIVTVALVVMSIIYPLTPEGLVRRTINIQNKTSIEQRVDKLSRYSINPERASKQFQGKSISQINIYKFKSSSNIYVASVDVYYEGETTNQVVFLVETLGLAHFWNKYVVGFQ